MLREFQEEIAKYDSRVPFFVLFCLFVVHGKTVLIFISFCHRLKRELERRGGGGGGKKVKKRRQRENGEN